VNLAAAAQMEQCQTMSMLIVPMTVCGTQCVWPARDCLWRARDCVRRATHSRCTEAARRDARFAKFAHRAKLKVGAS